MTTLDNSLTMEDQDALQAAVFDLDQLTVRVTVKLGTDSGAPPAPKHRDRANELIHRLVPEPANKQEPGAHGPIQK